MSLLLLPLLLFQEAALYQVLHPLHKGGQAAQLQAVACCFCSCLLLTTPL